MSRGTFLNRLTSGSRWLWLSDRHRGSLPPDLAETVMDLDSSDRHHAKQGRTTARFRFDGPSGAISVYLKRHDGLPWTSRLAALFGSGATPASREWRHLDRARSLGIRVPETVAAGEEVGPWGRLRGFLMVAELVGSDEVNRVIPRLAATMPAADFARFKREVVVEMAGMAARLHAAKAFHKDLYLCHFFLNPEASRGRRLTLIDLHRLAVHGLLPWRWRWKDLGQLLFSSLGVDGIDDRDRLRFWKHYRAAAGTRWPRFEARAVRAKAARYRAHNRPDGS